MINKYTLTGEEYTQLEKDALTLLIDYGFVEFPIDPFKLAKVAYDVEFVKYSSIGKKILKKIREYDATEDGFTVTHHMSDGSIRYSIYYDDSKNIYRQRYTIGHEIKHIFYGEEDTIKKDEDAAEYFSKVLLAPKCLIIINKIRTKEEIVEKFGLSHEAAQNHLRGINNRIASFGEELFDYEKEFLKDMKTILKKK